MTSSAATVASATYKKLTQLEHILLRADTYVGSKEPERTLTYVPLPMTTGDVEVMTAGPHEETNEVTEQVVSAVEKIRMAQKEITYVPAFFKIFDEILVNSADNKVRDPEGCNAIKVEINVETGEISVWNNGKG